MSDTDTIKLVRELRDALAESMRIIYKHGFVDEFLLNMQTLKIEDGIGVRANKWLERSQIREIIMPAEIKKIRDDMASSPEHLLGMLMGYRSQIKNIVAIVEWDDESFQLVNNAMKHRDLAFASAILQATLAKALVQETEKQP